MDRDEGALSTRGLERLLSVSGPVPWDLKPEVYDRLMDDVRWHEWIDISIYRSAFDFRGKVDPVAALAIHARLELPADTQGVEVLRERLAEMKLLGITNWRRGGLPPGETRD